MSHINRNHVLSVAKSYEFNNHNIEISNDVLKLFNQHKQLSKTANEACGILMCSIDNKDNVYINNATSPKPNDTRKRASFFLKDKSHQKELDELYKKSDATIFLCGTWHSHPEDSPTASALDIKEWGKFITGNNGNIDNFYFIIVGKVDISLYSCINHKIIHIKKEQNVR